MAKPRALTTAGGPPALVQPLLPKDYSKGHPEPVPPPKTLAGRLRMQISDEIVRGELAPGVVLDEMELARRFQVSRTPVREAIRLLGASGLVEERPHRSAVVARPDKTQLVAMFEALRELEALCAGLAAERMTATEHARLQRVHRKLLGVVAAEDPQRYHEMNEDFMPRSTRGRTMTTWRASPSPRVPASHPSAARSSAHLVASPSRTMSTSASSPPC